MTEIALGIDRATLHAEAERRRTFAIISHPDAGKTTLTEKLLLYGGAIQLAGSVTHAQSQRHATSDWMAIEQQRGISITSTVLQFPYQGHCVNLLDTPGHQDFSRRHLPDADRRRQRRDGARRGASGIEPQTRKLFEVCRHAPHPDLHLHQQARSPGARPVRAARRDRAEARHRRRADELADRRRSGLPGRLRSAHASRCISSSGPSTARNRAPVKVSGLDDPTLDATRSAPNARPRLREDDRAARAAPARLRSRCVAARRADAGLLRQRDHQLRRPAVPATRSSSSRRRRRRVATADRSSSRTEPELHRIRLQDPGEHGPAPPRPRRLHAHLLRRVRRDMVVRHARLERKVRLARAAPALRPGARRRSRRRIAGDVIGVDQPGHCSRSATRSAERDLGTFDAATALPARALRDGSGKADPTSTSSS